MSGAREALEPLLAEPGLDFRMARVLIDMLPDDDLDAARLEAARVSDARAAAFHDGERRLGRAAARALGWEERRVAWDSFLVYGPAASWPAAGMPAPDDWFHQLDDGEDAPEADEAAPPPDADPARFRTGDDLLRALIEAIGEAGSGA